MASYDEAMAKINARPEPETPAGGQKRPFDWSRAVTGEEAEERAEDWVASREDEPAAEVTPEAEPVADFALPEPIIRPSWLPANFRNGEALAKSYVEAQRKITELGNEKRALLDQVEDLSAQLESGEAQTLREENALLRRLVVEAVAEARRNGELFATLTGEGENGV